MDRPLVYDVERTRDGGSYCTRLVKVRQPSTEEPCDTKASICFTCICSFKREEQTKFEHGPEYVLPAQYASVLRGKEPKDHPAAPRVDVPWFWADARSKLPDASPGIDARKVDMTEYNRSRSPSEYRQLVYYTNVGDFPSSLNLHACAHLYASDRNSMFLVANANGVGDALTILGSISHGMIFHLIGDELRSGNGDAKSWFCQETWTPRSGAGRGVHASQIWDAHGRHLASSWQEGIIRIRKGQEHDANFPGGLKSMGEVDKGAKM